MNRILRLSLLPLFLAACGDDGGSATADASVTSADAAVDAVVAIDATVDADLEPSPVDRLAADAAEAICEALYRCCDGPDVNAYFAPYLDNQRLADFHAQMPPNAALDEAGCKALMPEVLAVFPFGDWIREARAGNVGFDEAALDACLAALDGAACGDEVSRALYDRTCLGYFAPYGGDEQRSMFSRSKTIDDACAPISDGIGARFYGTCDPTAAFCCYIDPGNPGIGCTFPYTGDGTPRTGTCQAASPVGGQCKAFPPLQMCQTGSDCGDESTCEASPTAPLAVGDACWSPADGYLGICQDGWCDDADTRECQPQAADGAECERSEQCENVCAGGTCAPSTFCTGDSDS